MTEQIVMRKDTNAGRLVSDMRAEHQQWLDAQPTSTSCFFCDWTTAGTAAECREAARTHREKEHPEAANRLGRRRGQTKPKDQRTTEENEQVNREAAEARSVRAEREDAERLAKIERGRQRDALAGNGRRRAAETGANHKGDTMHGNRTTSPASDRWNRGAIVGAIQAIAAETGFVPAQRDFNGPSTDKRPNLALIKRVFGSFGAAIEAAGYPRPRRGVPPLAIARGSEGEPQAGIAADFGGGDRQPPSERAVSESQELAPAEPSPSEDDEEQPDETEQPASDLPASGEVDKPEAALAIPSPRDPIRTAAIPYDAEILDDEADFLVRRAAVLRQMASAIRVLAEPRERAA